MIQRFSEGTAYQLNERGQGHHSLTDHGMTLFCAWDSPAEGEYVVHLAVGGPDEKPDLSVGKAESFKASSTAAIESELNARFDTLI